MSVLWMMISVVIFALATFEPQEEEKMKLNIAKQKNKNLMSTPSANILDSPKENKNKLNLTFTAEQSSKLDCNEAPIYINCIKNKSRYIENTTSPANENRKHVVFSKKLNRTIVIPSKYIKSQVEPKKPVTRSPPAGEDLFLNLTNNASESNKDRDNGKQQNKYKPSNFSSNPAILNKTKLNISSENKTSSETLLNDIFKSVSAVTKNEETDKNLTDIITRSSAMPVDLSERPARFLKNSENSPKQTSSSQTPSFSINALVNLLSWFVTPSVSQPFLPTLTLNPSEDTKLSSTEKEVMEMEGTENTEDTEETEIKVIVYPKCESPPCIHLLCPQPCTCPKYCTKYMKPFCNCCPPCTPMKLV